MNINTLSFSLEERKEKRKDYGVTMPNLYAKKVNKNGYTVITEPSNNNINKGKPTYSVYAIVNGIATYIGKYQMTRGKHYACDKELYGKVWG